MTKNNVNKKVTINIIKAYQITFLGVVNYEPVNVS